MSDLAGIKETQPGETDWDAAFVAMLEGLNALEGHDRRDALSEWVRSDLFSACGFILEGWQGELHREAWRCHRANLDEETPSKMWDQADVKAGRATILRLLELEGQKAAAYASHPFRLLWTQEDEPWIAAAVGCEPLLDFEKLKLWTHLDIRDVILWNPKSGKTKLLGDDQLDQLVLPAPVPDTLHVFTDTQTYFRAWARNRASFASVVKLHGLTESRDGHLPGALVIGDLRRIRLSPTIAPALVAEPPLSRRELNEAVVRAANLPKVEEARVVAHV